MNKIYLSLIFGILVLFSIVFVSAIDWDDAFVYYDFGSSSGSVVDDIQNHARNGTVLNSSDWVSGKIGNALNFDSSQEQFVNFTDSVGFFNWTEQTISFWIYPYTNFTTVQYFWDGFGNRNYHLMQDSSNPWDFRMGGTSATFSGATEDISYDVVAPWWSLNNWHHIVIVYDSSGDNQFWADGESRVNSTDGWTPADSTFTYMGVKFELTQFANYTIDEFGIFNKKLSASEIADLWNGGAGLKFRGDVIVTLDAPADNSDIIDNSTSFTSTITPTGDFDLANATLYVWHSNNTLYNSSTNSLSGTIATSTTIDMNISIIEDGYVWNVRGCEGNGASGNCSFASANRTVNVKNYSIGNQAYSSTAIEGTSHDFYFNFSVSSPFSVNSATLRYNNTNFTGSISNLGGGNYQVSKDVITPSVAADFNVTFNWTIDLSDGVIIASGDNIQTVSNLGLDNCSTHTIQILNLSVANEETKAFLVGSTDNTSIKVDVNLFTSNTSTSSFASFSQLYSKSNPARVCISENLSTSEFFMDALIEYDADGYAKEFYNINKYSLNASSNPSENITLYDLDDDDSQEFVITYKDESFLAVSDALIQIRRKYVDDGVERTVELPKTGAAGRVVGHLVIDDVIYSFVVIKDGNILATFNNKRAVCQNPTLETCTIDLNSFSSGVTVENFQSATDFEYTLTYAESTRTISSTFVIPSGAVSTIFLNVTMNDALGTSVCNEAVTTSSGTLSCVVASTFGNATAIAQIYKDGKFISQGTINLSQEPEDIYGVSLVFLGVFLLLTIIGAGISDDPIFTSMFLIIGVILLFALNLVDHSGFIGKGASLLWGIIAIILVVIKAAARRT